MKPAEAPDRSRLEWLAVAIVTVIGGGLRIWPIGRLGLTHFDEVIYAVASGWSLQPKGLASIDPTLISYAPPGYPILGGLAFALLGPSSGAMIAVSQIAGTLTIPIVAWLARRTFGPGSGFAAATLCTFSGPHIAFSRMALTDVSFLLFWLLALGAGMRFLERPGAWRAVVMGLAVGLAQQFKYNGWLTGGIVVASALLGVMVRPEARKAGPIIKTFGWGLLSAGLAWLVVWPWFRFVEAHGGYSALLRHQQNYLGGFRAWWPFFLIQADQAIALSGGFALIGPCLILAGLTPWIDGPAFREAATRTVSTSRRVLLAVVVACVSWLFVDSPYYLGLIAFPLLVTRARASIRLVGVWWLALTLISPFYHPYARLWLPLHACNWLLVGWFIADGLASIRGLDFSKLGRPHSTRFRLSITAFLLLANLGGFLRFWTIQVREAQPQADLLAPSDSIYRASIDIAANLPKEVKALRVLVRPPVYYYLAGPVTIQRMTKSDQLLGPGDGQSWVLVDSAILRSELGIPFSEPRRNLIDRFAKNWEVVEEFPTTLSIPTALDFDPGIARSDNPDRSSPLWLLRPRQLGSRK